MTSFFAELFFTLPAEGRHRAAARGRKIAGGKPWGQSWQKVFQQNLFLLTDPNLAFSVKEGEDTLVSLVKRKSRRFPDGSPCVCCSFQLWDYCQTSIVTQMEPLLSP